MSQSNIYYDLEEIAHVSGLRNNGEVFDHLDMEKYMMSEILVTIHEQGFYSYSQLEKYVYENDKGGMEPLLDMVMEYPETLRLAFDGVYRIKHEGDKK